MPELRLALHRTDGGWTGALTVDGAPQPAYAIAGGQHRGGLWPLGGGTPAAAAAALQTHAPAEALEAGRLLWRAFFPPDLALAEPVDLVIEAAPDDPALRLPWPLLADATGPILARPGGTLRREVRGGPTPPVSLRLPLRVLFVVASALDDPAVSAGAEYLGLLRRLSEAGELVRLRVVVRPTLAEVTAAIAGFGPQVVHWIGHGTAEHLLLPADDPPAVTPARLATLCASVPVVVLNACNTGGAAVEAPLAAAVVAAGVPVAVGMYGRVKDRACRLFTWHLYRALASGAPLAAAVSAGRREGLIDAPAHLHWARPALFMSAGITVGVDPAGLAAAQAEARTLAAFQPRRPYFCGRFAAQAAAARLAAGDLTAVMLRVDPRSRPKGEDRVGCTWLLEEIVGQLAALGRAPVALLYPNPQVDPPSGWGDLARQLARAVRRVRRDLGLARPPSALRAFAEAVPPIDDVPDEFTDALVAELAALQADSGRAPVVVLDDVHRYGALVPTLLDDCLGAFGLGTAARPVPTLVGYLESDRPEYARPVGALKTWAENAPSNARVLHLAPFIGDEELMAHQQFLLGQPRPLVFTGKDDAMVHGMLRALLEGVPSRMPTDGVRGLPVLKAGGFVAEADDDDLLAAAVDP